MKSSSFLLILLFIVEWNNCLSQSHEWEWTVQSVSEGYGYANNLAIDRVNNYYMTGTYHEGNIQLGDSVFQCDEGAVNSFVAGYDINGNFRWAKALGRVTGGPYGMVDDCRLAVDSQQNLYVAGEFDFTVDFGDTILQSYGNWDVFIAKYSATGQFLWAYQVGGPTDDQCGDLVIDYQDKLYLTMNHGRPSFDNVVVYGNNDTILNFHNYCAAVLSLKSNASFSWLIAGTSEDEVVAENLVLYDNRHLFAQYRIFDDFLFDSHTIEADLEPYTHLVVPFDEFGNPGEYMKYPFYWMSEMLIDIQSNFYATGYFNAPIVILGDTLNPVSSYDYLLVKYNYQMEPIWYLTMSNTSSVLDFGMCSDNDDGIYITAPFYDSVIIGDTVLMTESESGLFIADLDPAGKCTDAIVLEGTGFLICTGLQPDYCNNIMMCGEYNGQLVLGNDTVSVPESHVEALLAKISNESVPFLNLGPDTTILLTDSLVLDIGMQASSITWIDGSGGQEFVFRGSQYGAGFHDIWVDVENVHGCFDSDTITIQVIDNSLIDENIPVLSNLYPNPSSGVLHFDLASPGTIDKSELAAEIINLNGQLLALAKLHSLQGYAGDYSIDISSLKNGMYYLIIKDERRVVDHCKFIKIK
jgi:hypothetical protein